MIVDVIIDVVMDGGAIPPTSTSECNKAELGFSSEHSVKPKLKRG